MYFFMSKPWTAEQEVDKALAKDLIAQQFSSLSPASVQLMGKGWDNTVFRVNGKYVFRFPRRQIAVGLLEQEWQVLPKVAQRVSLDIPAPLFLGKPTDAYPWPFVGYQFVSGRTMCQARLSRDQRAACAAPLGGFLRELHSISGEHAREYGVGEYAFGKIDRAKRIAEKLPIIADLGLSPHVPELLQLLEQVCGAVLPEGEPVLVHGDMYARHLVVDDNNALSGVIDWGDLHVDSIAVDLQIAFSFLPKSAHDQFFQEYRAEVSAQARDYALLRALYSMVMIVAYSHDIGDKDLLDEGLVGLELLAEHA